MKQPKRQLGVLDLAHQFLRAHIQHGDLCIDATCGRGHDTKLLCELTGSSGKVIGFDIQQEAIDSARKLLSENGLDAELILDSHANMEQYAAADSAACIVFNFGWLPGGDHAVFTKADSSTAALKAALRLLKPGGWLSLCIYYGGANGYSERDAIDAFLASLDSRFYTVLQCRFPNRTGDPPYAVFVQKEELPCVP